MDINRSRRSFLAAGLGVPILASASKSFTPSPEPPAASRAATPKLQYRTLGKTGLRVTTVGFGCMITSDPSVIERAADLGVLYFDTARTYQGGNNERMVGVALKKKRKDIVLSSKTKARTREEALQHIDKSLQELGTDYLDIWYLHNKTESDQVTEDLLEAQRLAKQSGKIRFAGVSTHFNMDKMMAYLAKLGQTDVVLTTYNFSMRSVDAGANTDQNAPKTDMTAAIRAARKADLGIVVMKVLAGGVARVRRGDRLYGANPQALSRQLGQEGVPVAAIKWALKNESVDTAIVCMTSHDEFEENVRAMAEPYTERDEKLLTAQLAEIGPRYCRMCGDCGGVCEKGVPVPDVLRFLTYAEGYGQFALGREEFLKLGPAVAAVRCADCAHCTVQCPYGVQVSARLRRAQELFA